MKKLVDTEFTGENAKETLLNKNLNTSKEEAYTPLPDNPNRSKEEAYTPLPDKVSATPAPVLHRESDTNKSKFIPVEFREEPTSYGANFDVSSGKYPSSGELLSEIGRVWKDGNTDKAKELFNMYYSRTQDSTSSYYQPYSKHTNSTALDKISELTGIDFSGGITQDQINALWQMADTSKVGINGTYSSAKKNTAAQQLAYYLSVVQTDEETTQKAESELEQLMGDIQYLVGRGYSDEYVKQNVDMSKYSTLKKAMDAQNTVGGVLPNFNRAINLYGADTINGMIWAARNTTDGVYSGMSDIMNYYGFGSGYRPDVNSEAARDYTSDMYHPYSFGASDTKTMNAICKKYGITGWDEKWVEEHASELIANGDYGDAYKAAKNAAEAQSQLDALKKVCTDLLSKEDGSYNAEKVYSYVAGTLLKDSKYAMLNKMETARTDKEEHSAVALSDTVDFALPYFKSWLEDEEKKIVKGREAKARATIDELMPNSKEERKDKDYYYHYAMFCLNLKEGVKTNTERTAQEVLNFIQSEGNEKFIRQEGQSYEDYANGLGIYTQQLVEEKNEEEREAKKEAALTVQATDGFTMESFTDSTASMDKKDAADEWESFYEGIEDEIHGFGATDGNSKAWCESEIGSVLLSSTGRGATVSQTGYDTAGVVDKRTARLGNGIGSALNAVDEAHKNGAISTREYVKYLVALSTAMEKYGGIEAFKNAYNEGDENSEEYKLVHSLDATIETNTKAIELNTLKKNKQTATVAGNLLANPPAIMTEAQSQLYQSVLSVNLGEVKDADWDQAREDAYTYVQETYLDRFINDFQFDENAAYLAVNAVSSAAMMRINDVMRVAAASGIGFNDALDATYSGTIDDLIAEATKEMFDNYAYSYNSVAETVNTLVDAYGSAYQKIPSTDASKVIDDKWVSDKVNFLVENGMLEQQFADDFMEYYNSSEDKAPIKESLYYQLEGKESPYGDVGDYFASTTYKYAENQLEKQENGKGVAVLARGVTGDNQGGFFKALGLGAEMGWYQHKDTWLNVGEAFVRMDDAHREATYRDEYTRPELYQEITRQIMTIDDDDLRKRLLDQLNNYQGDIYDFDFDLNTVAIQDWRAQNEKKMQLVQEEGLNVLTPKEYELMMSMQNVVNSGFISAETAALTAILTGFGVPEFAGLLLANFAVTGSTEGASTTLALLDAGVNQNTARFMGLTNAIVTGATEAYFDETITWFMAKSNFGRAIDGAFDLDSASIANAVGSWLYGKTGSKGLSTIASYASGFLANTAQELLKSAISEPLQEGFEELSAQATEGAGKAKEGIASFWDSFDISAVFDVMGETFKNTVLQYAVGGGIMGNASKAVSSILGGSAGAIANLTQKNVEGAAESFKGGFKDAKSVGSKLVEFFKSGKLTQTLEEDYLTLKNAFAFKTTKANQYAEQQSDYIRDEFNEFLQECFYETEKDKIAAREGTKAWVEIDEGQIGETVRKAQADYDAALANVETAQSAVKQAQEVLEQRTEDVKNNETPTKQEANGLVEAKGVTEDAKSALAQAETNLQNAKQQLENARMARRTAFAQAMQASREVAAQQIEEIKAKKLAAVEAQRQANYETFKNEYLTRYTDTNTKGFKGLNNYWLVGLAQQESEKLWGTSDMMEKYAEMQSQACMKVVNLLENAFFGYSVEVTSDFNGSMGIDTKAKKIYINPNITFEQMFTGMIAHEMGHLAKATGKVEELMKSMMDTFYNGSKDSSAYKDAVEWVHEHAPETVDNEDLTDEEVFTYTIESLFAGGKLNNLGGMPIMTFAKMLVNNDMELGSDLYTFLMKQAVVVREMNKDKFFKKELQKAQTQYADFVAQLADAIKGSQEVLKESASETAQAGEISDDTSKTENDTTKEVMSEKSVDVEGENTEKQQAIAPATEKAALPAPKQKLLLPSPVKTLFDNEATEAKTDTPVVETAEDYKKMVEEGADFAFSQMVKPDLPVFAYNPQTAEYALADGVIEELSEDAKAIVEAAVETGTEAQYNAAHAENLDNIWTEEREETRKSVLDGIKQEYMEVLDGANDKTLEDVDTIVQEQLDEKLIKPEDMEIINEWRSGKFVAPKTEGIGMTPAENEVDIADRETYEYTTAPKEGADIEYTFTGKQKGVNKKTAFNDKKVTPFYNTHWDQFYFARNMAERLLEDAGNYYAPETIVTEAEYGGVPEFTRTKSSSTPELQQLSRFFSRGKGSSYERMWNAIQEFIDAYDNNKPIKNTAGMKALEVMLHNMLTRGYTMITGERIPSNTEYINLRKGNATEAVDDTTTDDAYAKAVESDDMETAQQMVNDAADKAGYTIPVYHGTTQFGFTAIDVSKSDDAKNELRYSKTGADSKTFVDANGDELMDVIDGVATKYSHTTWNMTDKEKMLDNLVKGGHDAEKARAWINAVNAIDAIIADNIEELDFDSTDEPFMKKNAEYVITLDASTLCDKRRLYQGTFNTIQHILSQETLSSEDMIKITNLLRENGLKAPCAICYVESRRRHIGEYAEKWLNKWKGDYKPSMDELTTTDGLDNLKKTHPEVAKAFIDSMNRKGTQNPKLVQLRTAYNGDLTRLTPGQIEQITALGGVRIQSFSDFEAVHTLDMMQSILDMASMNLTSQAYTKVPNFAKIFGKTGIKINLSLIAEGVDENGKLILSPIEGMDIETALKLRNGDVEGVTEEEKQKYRENVGTIVVVGNDEQLYAAMNDDRIDYIIPFHKSGWGKKEIALLDALVGYENYEKYQIEHIQDGYYKNGNPKYHALDKKAEKLSPYGSVPYGQEGYNGYWDYNLTGDENAATYLRLCEEKDYIPKFYDVLTKDADGHWVAPSGYWKLLIDFKMYDNNGVGAPQKTVVADFNTVAAENTLNEYKESGEQANVLPVSKKVVGQFIEGFNAERGTDYQIPDQYKSADTNTMKSRTFSDLGKTVRDALIDAYNTLAAEALDKGDITSYRQMMGRMYGQLAKHQGNTSSKLDTPLNTLKLLANDLGTHIYDKIKMGRAEVEVGTMEGDGETNPLLMNAKIQAKYDAWSNAISTDYVSGKTFAGIMGGIADTAFQRLVNAGIIGSTDEQTAGDFADWFFNYMTHNDAQLTNTAKAYAKTFADAIAEDGDAKTRNMWSAIQMRRKQISGYINADSYTKAMTYLKSKSERKENPGKNWVDNIRGFLTTTVDRSLIASVVDESATNNTHALQNAVLYSPYMLRRAEKVLSGRSFVDADGHELKQFATLAQEIEKSGMEPGEDNYKTFNTYIMVMAALDRIGQGKNPFNVDENIELLGFTVAPNEEELKEVARNIEATRPDVVKAAEGFWRFNRNFIQTYLVNEGLLDAKTWADWQDKTPHYASLKRYMDENPNASASSAKNNALGVTLEKFVGHSNRQIINPVESMVDMVHSVVKGVTQNRTKQVFADLIDNNPDTGFIAKRVDANEVNIHDSDVIAVHTYNPVQSTEIAGNNENVHDVSNENPIETRYYKINNKELYNLLAGVDTAQVNKAAKAFGKVTRTMTMLTTGVNALFTGKNAIRDFQHSVNYGTWAYTYLDGLFKWVSAYRDIGKELKNGTGSQQARDYVNLGGGEWERMGTTGKKNITNVRQQLFGETTAEKVKNKALQFITFSEINGKIEAASRFAEYKYGRNATGTDNTFNTLTNKVRTALGQETNNGEVTDESKRKAFMSAQEATVDFQRTGTGLQNFKKCIPFFNATMQGNYQDFRVVTNLAKSGEEGYRARETLAKTVINNIISGIFAAGMNLWFGSDDDKDEYLNVDEGIKSDYILLPGRRWLGNIVGEDVATFIYGGRDANRAPISAGTLEHIFYNFGRKTVEDIYTGKEVTGIGKDLVSIAWNSVITGFSELTTIYSPIQNVNENMAWYGDQLIADRVMSDHPVDKTKWSNSSTSDVASDISKLLNWVNETALGDLFIPDNAVSPIAIEYLAQQYTGIIGQMLLPLLQTNKYTGESITNPTDRTGLGNGILGKAANTAIYVAHSIYNTGLKSYTIDTDASSQIGDTYDEFEDRITDIVKSANESAPYYIRSDLTTDERTSMFEEAKAMQSKGGILYEADDYIKEQWAKYGVIMRGEEWTETDESGNEVKINYGAYSERDRQILAEGCYKAIRDKQSEVIQTVGEFENKYICDQTLASVFSSSDTTIIPLTKTERKMQSLGEAYQADRENDAWYITYAEQMYNAHNVDSVTPTPDYEWRSKKVDYSIPDEYRATYDAYFKEEYERAADRYRMELDSGEYGDNPDKELSEWKKVRDKANDYAREMYRLDYGIT